MNPNQNPTRPTRETLRIQSLLKQAADALLLLQLDKIPMSRAATGKIYTARGALCELEVAILFNETTNQK